MGFYSRKPISFGSIMFNYSKFGIGATVDVKESFIAPRSRGNYIRMDNGGVHYRAVLVTKKHKTSDSEIMIKEYQSSIVSPNDNLLSKEIERSGVSFIINSSAQDIVNEINSKKGKSTFMLLAFLIVFIPIIGTLIVRITVAIILAVLIANLVDSKRTSTILFYDIEEQTEHNIQQFYDSFQDLNCKSSWYIYVKTNTLIRINKLITHKSPPSIITNVKVPTIKVNRQTLYFFPDRILVYGGNIVENLMYNDLKIIQKDHRIVEKGICPSDGSIVDYIWEHEKKSGGPDLRYSNNQGFPILNYSNVCFSSNSGLYIGLQLSRQYAGKKFIEQFEKFKSVFAN